MLDKCPGQDMQFWKPGDIFDVECPRCGKPVEFFKDDIRRRCKTCGHMFLNPKLNLGCAKWCQYAEQCVGGMGKEELKENLTLAMKEYFGDDKKRIDHALKVTELAEKILEGEKEGNPQVVIGAGLLHDIGIHQAEKKYGSAKGSYQEKEGPPIAKEILDKLGWREEVIEEVCQIIGNHHSPGKIDTLNFKILFDADWLVNLGDEYDIKDKDKLKKVISRIFLTPTGKKMAEEIYL